MIAPPLPSPRTLPADDLAQLLDRTRPIWNDLRGGRLLVAGGAGFFGRWMLETLLHADEALGLNAEVVVLGRDRTKLPGPLRAHPKVGFHAGDVRTFDFPEEEFTHVVHLATSSTNSDDVYDVIVEGTRRLLRCAEARGARRFLFASSGAVYGPQPPDLERVPEDYAAIAPGPFTPYGAGKRAAEALVAQTMGLQGTIARGFAFVGPHLPLDAHFAIGNFVRDAMAGRPIEVRGDGTAVRSYMDAADLAAWLWTILLRGETGRAYNVGSERALSIRELAHLVAHVTGADVPVRIAAAPGNAGNRYVPDTLLAQRELGLEETIALEDAVLRTVRYHQVHDQQVQEGLSPL